MRIAFAGLATGHPYGNAKALPEGTDLVVWEPDAQRVDRFLAQHPGAVVAEDLNHLLATHPDGVVLTVPTPEVASALADILDKDHPCFITKPAAATAEQLAALDKVMLRSPQRVLTSSVLRFAPALADAVVPRDQLTAVRVTVRHDVGLWATGYNPWQDDPSVGGGTLVTMGIHGVELLVAMFGPFVRLVSASAATRGYPSIRSEDTGLLTLQWSDGLLGVVEVLGVASKESYEVVMHGVADETRVLLDGGTADADDALGYRGTVEAFLRMIDGEPSPVPWSQSRAVLSTLVAARSYLG